MMSIFEVDKVGDGMLKYFFKMGVCGFILDDIIDWFKQGFGFFVYEWFFDKLGDVVWDSLKNFCVQMDFYDLFEIEVFV